MKIAAMMEAYANATGDRIMHHIGVAEVLVQLIESSRASRAEAIEQFREAMVGYVNESIDFIKAADIADKDELAKAVRKLISEMHSDRHDILAGEAPHTTLGDAVGSPVSERLEADGGVLEPVKMVEPIKAASGEGAYLSGELDGDSPSKDGRARGVKHAA
jgi:hypothetical protein